MTAGLKGRVAVAVAWMTSARAAVRLLGLVSTLVLARLLAPADFGLVAMAISIAAALKLLTAFSFDAALIQERQISRAHYDTAWTLNLAMAVLLAMGLVLASGFAAAFYREPRLEHLMLFVGIKYVIDNAGNPGTVDFSRNLAFGAMRSAPRDDHPAGRSAARLGRDATQRADRRLARRSRARRTFARTCVESAVEWDALRKARPRGEIKSASDPRRLVLPVNAMARERTDCS